MTTVAADELVSVTTFDTGTAAEIDIKGSIEVALRAQLPIVPDSIPL